MSDPLLLPAECHRDAIVKITTARDRARHRAMWARAIGDRHTYTQELAVVRSARRALRTHRMSLSVALGYEETTP